MNGRLMSTDLRGGEGDLGLLGLFLQALQRHRILAQVDAVFLLEGVHEPADERVVPIVAAEVGVAVGRLDLENAVADFEHGHVKCAAAQIEHRDLLVLLLVEAIGERRSRRLVDDAEHIETGDLARILGGLTLRIVEISGHRDDGLSDFLTEIGLGIGFQFTEHKCGDLLGRELLGLVTNCTSM
jgi:hypothetical protein